MKRSLAFSATLLALALALSACGGIVPPTNVPGDNGDAVATQVAATLTALAPTPTPDPLPTSLYYLGRDGGGLYQVFRLATDGVRRVQLTFEPADVNFYSVHPLDGRIAYVSNNVLYLVNGDGSGRQALVDPGPLGTDISYATMRVSAPLWSPDGGTLAYGLNGLVFRNMTTGATNLVMTNNVETFPTFSILREGYEPYAYSPDRTRLLVRVQYYEGQDYGVYDLASGQFRKLVLAEGYGGSCCDPVWSSDSQSVLMASPYLGMLAPGVWRYNASTGVGVALLPDQNPDGSFNFASSPYQAADGSLTFFYANLAGYPDSGETPLALVRSGADAVTGRALVLSLNTLVREGLWVPNGSAVVIARPPAEITDYRSNNIILLRLNGSPELLLAQGAYSLRWGP